MYTLDLGNGTILENLELNGNNFVSNTEITNDMFEGISDITITDDENNSEILHNAVLVNINQFEGNWYFILRERTEQEIRQEQLEAQIFFTALSTDSLMEEE